MSQAVQVGLQRTQQGPNHLGVPTVYGRNPFRTTWKPWLKPLFVVVFTLDNHQKPGFHRWCLRRFHGCCWETCYMFAYCGLVVEIPTELLKNENLCSPFNGRTNCSNRSSRSRRVCEEAIAVATAAPCASATSKAGA